MEYPTDILLAHLVRAQLISNQVARVSLDDALDRGSRLPVDLSFGLFQSQLAEIDRQIPPELEGNGLSNLY